MARPSFLKSMPRSASEAFDFIKAAHLKGISARAMEPIIRKTIVGISRTTINRVVRGIKGIKEGVADLRFLKRGAIPDPTRIKLARSDILTEYSFTLRMDGINPFSGLLETRRTQVVTDRLLSREDLEELAEATIEGKEGSVMFQDTVFTIEEAFQRA